MKRKGSIWFFFWMVLFIPGFSFLGYQFFEQRFSKLPVHHTVENFELVNQHERKIKSTEWYNRIVVVDFFFTRCPSVCPKMTFHLKQIANSFKDDSLIRLASITVDPSYDSIEILRNYINRFALDDSKWDFLTGEKRRIYSLARSSFKLVATDGDGGPNDFIHSDKLVLLDRHQRIRGYYDGTSENETAQLISDIKKLKKEK